MIGSEIVAKAAPDGYTLLLASQTNAISASLYRSLPFDPVDDFAPIALIGREPGVLVVHPSLPVHTLSEFIAYVKERPGKVDYASSGNGSGQHLFMALLASMTGMKLNHVPYRGSGQATTDLLAGVVAASIPGTAGMVGHIKSQTLAGAARYTDNRRIRRAWLFRVCVDGTACAERNATGGDRTAASRARAVARDRGGAKLHGDGRHRNRRIDERGARRVLSRRERAMGEGYYGNRR